MFTKSQVILDTSLAELYAGEHLEGDPPTTLIPCYWCSDLDYTDSIPKTYKYLYQGTPPPTTPKETRRLVIQCLILEPQRFTFAAGPMEAALFDIGLDTGRLDAIKTLSVLPIARRPRVLFVKGIEDLMYERSRAQLAVVVPHEQLASHPQTVGPDVLYNLLSKRGLALSGLPTPQTAILDLDNFPGSVDQKLRKAVPWIHSFALPRVFKTQQGMSSVGTFLVRTEKERGELVSFLLKNNLRSTLRSVNIKNAHLYPSSLISQAMVTQTQDCFAVAFFVRRNGEATFLGACRQDMDPASNAWMGATIMYSDQDRLRRMLGPLVSQIAKYLNKEGYYGPAGEYVLEQFFYRLSRALCSSKIPRAGTWFSYSACSAFLERLSPACIND